MDPTLPAAPFTLLVMTWRTFTVCSVRNESLRPQDASWAWREAWPLELLADTKASSRSVCLLAPTREVRVLDLPQVALWVGLIANLLSEEPI